MQTNLLMHFRLETRQKLVSCSEFRVELFNKAVSKSILPVLRLNFTIDTQLGIENLRLPLIKKLDLGPKNCK